MIEYLKYPPSRERLVELIDNMGITPRELLRARGAPYAELDLGDPKWSDDELIDFMIAHPILINRPIVVSSPGTKLCRPSEVVLDILPNPEIGPFTKEDRIVGSWLGLKYIPATTLRYLLALLLFGAGMRMLFL